MDYIIKQLAILQLIRSQIYQIIYLVVFNYINRESNYFTWKIK